MQGLEGPNGVLKDKAASLRAVDGDGHVAKLNLVR